MQRCSIMIGKRFVRRQWGWYLTLLDRAHFKVKLLCFKRDGRLSNQYHRLLSELWLFLSGEQSGAWRRINEDELHTYHAIRPTLVLEIQYGDKCDEKDIVRV